MCFFPFLSGVLQSESCILHHAACQNNILCAFVRDLYRSGSDEEFHEKDQLLTEITTVYDEKDVAPVTSSDTRAAERSLAITMRDDACATLSKKQVSPSGQQDCEPSSKRRPGTADTIVSYLEAKERNGKDDSTQKLALEQDRFKLQEKELEWKKQMKEQEEERLKKQLEGEKEERKLSFERLELERMRLRMQEKENEKKYQAQQEEAKMRAEKEADDRRERQLFMQLMAGMVAKLQDK